MYKVYCDEKLIYHPNVDGLKLLNPKLDLEVNKNGTFAFTIYPYHPFYTSLRKLKSIITVYNNNEILFRGRILNDTKGFKNEKQVTCEGELAFLLDSTQRPYEYKGDIAGLFTKFITEHNKQVDESKRFKVGEITVTDKNGYINRSDTQYLNTRDSIFKKLIDTHGGYLQVRHESDGVYLDYLEDFKYKSNQDIEICKNILDIKKITKGDQIYTAIIPLGAKLKTENDQGQMVDTNERLTIKDVNSGKDYLYDQEAVNNFGWIFRTKTWDDVTLPENLLRKGKEELANAFAYAKTLEISAVDLAGTRKKVSAFRVGTYNKVTSKLHDIDELLLVTKLSINLANPKSDKMTLGVTFKSFTEQDKENTDFIGDIVEKVESILEDFNINKPLIDSILSRLTITLKKNHSEFQNYDPTENVYTPDYTKLPLIITPTAKYKFQTVSCSYIWKRIVNGEEVPLEGWEHVDSNGVLTINRNMIGKNVTYICYGTYTNGKETSVDSATIDFSRVDNGENGKPGEPGKDAAIQSDVPPSDKTQLWLDTSVVPPLLKQWNGQEWIVVNDMTEELQHLRQELISSILQTTEKIQMEVSEKYYAKDETDTLISEVGTKLEQTKKDFTFTFNEFKQSLGDLSDNTNAEFQKISRYIRFESGNIVLGEVGNELTLKIQHDRISFLQNNVEVAYFSDRKLYVTDGEYTNSLVLGNFAFMPRANGNLSFRKVR